MLNKNTWGEKSAKPIRSNIVNRHVRPKTLISAEAKKLLYQNCFQLLVTPIHKKGARNQVCNYRPISLTSIFSKFMESIIKDHLMSHLLTNNLLSAYQFGFIPGRSCTTQLLHVLDYFTQHLDNGNPVDVIYLDFQKAFDSVPTSA